MTRDDPKVVSREKKGVGQAMQCSAAFPSSLQEIDGGLLQRLNIHLLVVDYRSHLWRRLHGYE